MPFESRRPPTEMVDGLSPPHPDFPYFGHAGALPFRPGDRAYSPVNAWWLADASMLVYDVPAAVAAAVAGPPLGGQGYRLEWLGTPDDNRGMVLRNDEALIVVFRGTRIEVHAFQDLAEVALIRQDDLWRDGLFAGDKGNYLRQNRAGRIIPANPVAWVPVRPLLAPRMDGC